MRGRVRFRLRSAIGSAREVTHPLRSALLASAHAPNETERGARAGNSRVHRHRPARRAALRRSRCDHGIGAEGARIGKAVTGKLVCAVRGHGACGMPTDALAEAYGSRGRGADRGQCARGALRGRRLRLAARRPAPLPRAAMRRHERPRRASIDRSRASSRRRWSASSTAARAASRPRARTAPAPRAGNVYLQYWLYYPDSATRAYHRAGFHTRRLGELPGADPRGRRGRCARQLPQLLQLRPRARQPLRRRQRRDPRGLVSIDLREAAWGPANGFVWVSDGSHAGRAAGGDGYFRSVPKGGLRLIPIEPNLDRLGRLGFTDGIAPPWRKPVYTRSRRAAAPDGCRRPPGSGSGRSPERQACGKVEPGRVMPSRSPSRQPISG